MSSFTSCKKVELHLHLEGAASPPFVRDICKSSGAQIPEFSIKLETIIGRILTNSSRSMK